MNGSPGRTGSGTGLPEADLSVNGGAVTVKAGRKGIQTTYTIVVTNAGPETAEDATLNRGDDLLGDAVTRPGRSRRL